MVPPTPTGQQLPLGAVATLLGSARLAQPGQALMAFANQLVPVDHLSVVRYGDEGPVLEEGHTQAADAPNITQDCFGRYRQRFCGLDEATHRGQQLHQTAGNEQGVLGMHLVCDDLPDPAWRHQIYERERLASRLTLLYTAQPRMAFSLNLYRNQRHGRFGPQEIHRLLSVAPLLRQVHVQSLALQAIEAAGSLPLAIEQRVARAEARLARHGVALSRREAAVCARIACGISADGIAADLGVASSTVATLRKRAYAKLGMSSRLALVRLVG